MTETLTKTTLFLNLHKNLVLEYSAPGPYGSQSIIDHEAANALLLETFQLLQRLGTSFGAISHGPLGSSCAFIFALLAESKIPRSSRPSHVWPRDVQRPH